MEIWERMINADKWMIELTEKLKVRFDNKLLFSGLQGSYRRGEANEDSDIDAVVILETLSFDDLSAYREIILSMPHNHKACGFISGRQELLNWPKHELLQFKQDIRSYYGEIDKLLPDIERKHVIESVKISASSLYHLCCHAVVHTPTDISALRSMYKNASFLLLSVFYLRESVFIPTKKELLLLLEGDEKKILGINMNWDGYSTTAVNNADEYYDLILRWSKLVLNFDFAIK